MSTRRRSTKPLSGIATEVGRSQGFRVPKGTATWERRSPKRIQPSAQEITTTLWRVRRVQAAKKDSE